MLLLCTAFSEPMLCAEDARALLEGLYFNELLAPELQESIDIAPPFPQRIEIAQQVLFVRKLVPYVPRVHGQGILKLWKPMVMRGHSLRISHVQLYENEELFLEPVEISIAKTCLLYRIRERQYAVDEREPWFAGALGCADVLAQVIAQLRGAAPISLRIYPEHEARRDSEAKRAAASVLSAPIIQLSPSEEAQDYTPVFANVDACAQYLKCTVVRAEFALRSGESINGRTLHWL